jgi:hypothetical protein
VDAKRAANLDAKGRTLREIGAELGISSTTVSDQLRRAGVTVVALPLIPLLPIRSCSFVIKA